MKKNFMKTMVAAVCVVAASVGGLKAYNTAKQSEADMLLAENVEALSASDGDSGLGGTQIKCYTSFVYEAGASVINCATCKRLMNMTDKWNNFHDYCWV